MLNMIVPNFYRFMYAVGGQDGVSCLNIVEKYDSVANHWSRVAPMSTRRLGVAVAVLDAYLFAIGGSDGTSPLNTVEKYDPKNNQWIPIRPMGTKRKHLGAAVYQGCIYVGEITLNLKYVVKPSEHSRFFSLRHAIVGFSSCRTQQIFIIDRYKV